MKAEKFFGEHSITISVILAAFIIGVALVAAGPSVNVSVKQPVAQAQAALPKDVEKFVDGNITCYTFDRWNAFRSADTSAGISCVNNK